MRVIFFLLFSFITSGISLAQVQWLKFSDLEKKLKDNPKPVFVDMYTTWCGPCKMMDNNTFNHPKVAEYINQHFYAVKFNAEGDEVVLFRGQRFINEQFEPNKRGRNSTHPFAGNFAVNGRLAYPTTAYLDAELKLLVQPIQGYLTPDKIEPILKYFGSGVYKTTSWEEFQKTFVAEW